MAGRFDHVTGVGIAPRPVQQPIPIWFGGASPAAFRRAGRLADGWLPMMQPGLHLDEALGYVAEGAEQAGRDPSIIGMEGRLEWRGDVDEVVRRAGLWKEAGASHLSINTMHAGLATVDDHLAALRQVAEGLSLA
jgi:alkanesulfonate monooxygenase SsuD/methylene tetrahydromethanopterin reductase-like flavin-dependent oxidoreductase (luciferase family)